MDPLELTLEEFSNRNKPRRRGQHPNRRRSRDQNEDDPNERRKRPRRDDRFNNHHDSRYTNNHDTRYNNNHGGRFDNYQHNTYRQNPNQRERPHFRTNNGGHIGGYQSQRRNNRGSNYGDNNQYQQRNPNSSNYRQGPNGNGQRNYNRNNNTNRYQNRRDHYESDWRGNRNNQYQNGGGGGGPSRRWRNDRNYQSHHNQNQSYQHSNQHQQYPIRTRPRIDDALPRPDRPGKNYYIPSSVETNSDTDDVSDHAKYGYVTLVMKGDNYIPGALILAHSLRVVASKYPLIVMITDDVSPKARDALSLLFDYVVNVPYIEYIGLTKEMKTNKQREKYKEWASGSFTKWNLLNLNTFITEDVNQKTNDVHFEKLLFLDSDKIVIRNIDHLFTDQTLQCPAGTFSSPWTNKVSANGLIDYYPKGIQHGEVVPAESIYDALYNNGFVAVGTGMLFEPNEMHYTKFIEMLDRKWISDEYLDNNIDKEKIRMRRIKGKFAVFNADIDVETKQSQNVENAENAESVNSENVENSENVDTQKTSEVQDTEDIEPTQSDFPEPPEPKANIRNSEKTTLTEEIEAVQLDKASLSPVSKMAMEEKASDRTIGFRNCYSMLDEQSIVFFYFYHKLPWHYLDVKYNFIPWHFKWLETDDKSLDIPSVLHFFGTKPWVQSPVEWRDLQAWWGLVFHLLNFASKKSISDGQNQNENALDPNTETTPIEITSYSWNEEEQKLVESFFDLDLMNKLPLGIFVDDKDADFVDESDEVQKRLTSGVRCFWCYELAKRDGQNPDEKIKNNSYEGIEWIFHCPVDPSTGKLCCPKLLETLDSKKTSETKHEYEQYDVAAVDKEPKESDDIGRERKQAMQHESDGEEDELAATMNAV